MNWKTWAPLAIAAVLGLAAWMLGKDSGAPKAAPEAHGPKLAQVVVAKADVPAGAALKPTDLGMGQLPESQLPAGTFSNAAEATGRVVAVSVVKGQAVLESILTPRDSAAGLPAIVPDGMRAVTLEVNEFSGVAGLLAPGCRVDVVSTLNDTEPSKTAAKTIASNIRVIAVGKRFGPAGAAAAALDDPAVVMSKAVTLLVSPREAEVIELACHLGSPRLVLRGSRDSDTAKSVGVTVAELRGTGPTTKPSAGFSDTLARLFGVSAAPTTQPAVASASPAGPTTKPVEKKYHEVTIIRAGVETVTRLEIKPDRPAKPSAPTEGSALVGDGDQLKPVPDEGR